MKYNIDLNIKPLKNPRVCPRSWDASVSFNSFCDALDNYNDTLLYCRRFLMAQVLIREPFYKFVVTADVYEI